MPTIGAVIFTSLVTFLVHKEDTLRSRLWGSGKIILLVMALFCLCLALASTVIDISYDGQGYHQAIESALNHGWNPIKDDVFNLQGFKSENTLWVSTYPIASHLITYAIYSATGWMEAGKGLTLFLIILSTSIAYLALRELHINKVLSVVLVGVAVLNPINLLQIFTFGLDSQYYSLIVIIASAGLLLINKWRPYIAGTYLALASILLINNKLTSITTLAIVLGLIGICALVFKRYKLLGTGTLFVIPAILLGVLFFGYHPFITNFQTYGTPLYPVVGTPDGTKKAYDYTENLPSNYLHSGSAKLFVDSLFFVSNGNFRPPDDVAKIKIPFTFTTKELNSFIYLGPKEGGFGVLFSGIVILLAGLLATATTLAAKRRHAPRHVLLATLGGVFVLISCVVNPLSSVARYIPQLWLAIPILLWISWQYRHRIVIMLNALIILAVTINAFMIFSVALSTNIKATSSLHKTLDSLKKESAKQPLMVNFSQSEGNVFLLNSHGIHFKEDTGMSYNFKCPQGTTMTKLLNNIGNSTSLYCKP